MRFSVADKALAILRRRYGSFVQRLLRRSFFSHFPTLRTQLSPRRSRALPTPLPLPGVPRLRCTPPRSVGRPACRPPWLPSQPVPCSFRPHRFHPPPALCAFTHSLSSHDPINHNLILLSCFAFLCSRACFCFCFCFPFACSSCFFALLSVSVSLFLHAGGASNSSREFSLHVFAPILY